MAKIKGEKEYRKWQEGERLSRKQAMLAHCYSCNGEGDSGKDCNGRNTCPMYQFFVYRGKRESSPAF